MTRRLIALTLLVTLVGAVLLAPTSALAQATNPFQDIPVTGTLSERGSFQGLLDITSFAVHNGVLVAEGTLSGTVSNRQGNVLQTIPPTAVQIPVNDIIEARQCRVLFLQSGPIDLELLGLEVHVNQLTITIEADPSEGILGELLCAIAGGFDQGLLDQVANLLNQLLALLG